MLSPSPSDLLRGVRRQLSDQVLPAVDDPAAQRQIRAATHILARLERSWPELVSNVAADVADVLATLDLR